MQAQFSRIAVDRPPYEEPTSARNKNCVRCAGAKWRHLLQRADERFGVAAQRAALEVGLELEAPRGGVAERRAEDGDAASQRLVNAFFKKTDDGSTPFDGVRTKDAGHGLVFLDSLAWLDCEFSGEHSVGDHVVVFGRVRAGETFHPGDPSIHLRKNGLGY